MVDYSWVPPQAESVRSSTTTTELIPAGFIRQKAWCDPGSAPETRPSDVRGVYAQHEPNPPTAGQWESVIWRWADTWRRDAIQRVPARTAPDEPEFPAYRFELTQSDKASEGTVGDRPRAELFSVDPEQKRRNPLPDEPLPPAYFSRNNEYWATFALFIPDDFPSNHRWATLFQRKLDDKYFARDGDNKFTTWLTINVHGSVVDVSAPGYPSFEAQPADRRIASLINNDKDEDGQSLVNIRGQWAQFVVHENLSSTSGSADVQLILGGALAKSVSLTPYEPQPGGEQVTFPVQPADVRGFFQYGYYRENAPGSERAGGPATGVVYASPVMLSNSGTDTPALP